MVFAYLVVVCPNKDYYSNKRVVIDSFHQIEYMKYFDNKNDITRIWKLFAKDFTKLEEFKKMPLGTIDSDLRTFYSMEMRSRFAMGDMILVYRDSSIDIDSLEKTLNSMEGEKLSEFINDAKI